MHSQFYHRSKTISFAIMKKRETEDIEKCLEDRIRKLDSLSNLSDEDMRQLDIDKRELISIREKNGRCFITVKS